MVNSRHEKVTLAQWDKYAEPLTPRERTTVDDTHNIGTPETLNLADVNLYHRNPRVGDVQAIVASLRANGVYKPVVVNKGTFTGRPLEVLAGNHTVKAHRQLAEEDPEDEQWSRLAAWVVDVDEDRAARIVLADNRTADLGSYDDQALIDLLESTAESDAGIEGTGYSQEDLQALLDLAAGPDSLEDLEAEFGEPEDDDFWITISLRVPLVVNDQWKDWARAYDSAEEAFEALMDKAGDYGQA